MYKLYIYSDSYKSFTAGVFSYGQNSGKNGIFSNKFFKGDGTDEICYADSDKLKLKHQRKWLDWMIKRVTFYERMVHNNVLFPVAKCKDFDNDIVVFCVFIHDIWNVKIVIMSLFATRT